MEETIALTVDNLHKSFAQHKAVNGVSFSIKKGECVGILGPNGAGKSTTLDICLGKTQYDSGNIHLLGYAIPDDTLNAKQKVGVVPQMDYLDPDFNCIDNLKIYSRYFNQAVSDDTIADLLQFAGLSTRATAKVPTLSGGMKRRLTLARALVNNPEFIFLDEPTTGLDPQARLLIWERLRNLRDTGKTLLLTTHFMDEAERLCDRIYIMDCGKIISHGTPTSLIQQHVEKYVIEIYSDNISSWLNTHSTLFSRHEIFGQMVYCYTDNADPLVHELQLAQLRYISRPASLEDVFLAITGKDLRE